MPERIQELANKNGFLGKLLSKLQVHKFENEHFLIYLKEDIPYYLSVAKEFNKFYPSGADLLLESAQNDPIVERYFFVRYMFNNSYCPNSFFYTVNKKNRQAYFFNRLQIDKAFGLDWNYKLEEIL